MPGHSINPDSLQQALELEVLNQWSKLAHIPEYPNKTLFYPNVPPEDQAKAAELDRYAPITQHDQQLLKKAAQSMVTILLAEFIHPADLQKRFNEAKHLCFGAVEHHAAAWESDQTALLVGNGKRNRNFDDPIVMRLALQKAVGQRVASNRVGGRYVSSDEEIIRFVVIAFNRSTRGITLDANGVSMIENYAPWIIADECTSEVIAAMSLEQRASALLLLVLSNQPLDEKLASIEKIRIANDRDNVGDIGFSAAAHGLLAKAAQNPDRFCEVVAAPFGQFKASDPALFARMNSERILRQVQLELQLGHQL